MSLSNHSFARGTKQCIIATCLMATVLCNGRCNALSSDDKGAENISATELVEINQVKPTVLTLTKDKNPEVQPMSIRQEESISIQKTGKTSVIETKKKRLKKKTKAKTKKQKKPYSYYEVHDEGMVFMLPKNLQDYTYNICKEYNIEKYYDLIIAQMYHESQYDAKAISKSKDYGLMQINKCNHDWLKKELGITNFLDAKSSIRAGVYMMSSFLLKYDDVQMALVCYNMGENKVKKGIYSSSYSRSIVNDDMKKLVKIK